MIEHYWNVQQILKLNWELVDRDVVGRTKGVYILVNKMNCQIEYAGKSTRIGYRLKYYHPIYDPDLHNIFILRLDTEKERRYIENRCIELIMPKYNIRRGFMPKDLLHIMAEREYRRIFDSE